MAKESYAASSIRQDKQFFISAGPETTKAAQKSARL
jgi:hypothetical protein